MVHLTCYVINRSFQPGETPNTGRKRLEGLVEGRDNLATALLVEVDDLFADGRDV